MSAITNNSLIIFMKLSFQFVNGRTVITKIVNKIWTIKKYPKISVLSALELEDAIIAKEALCSRHANGYDKAVL